MGDTPNYRRALGLGAPLLSAQVEDAEVTLHRQEAVGLMRDPAPVGSLQFVVTSPDSTGGGMVGRPWGGTTVGEQRVVCGELPAKAAMAEAAVAGGGPVAARVASGVWLVVAPRDRRLTVTFRDAAGRTVKRLRVRPWPATPDLPSPRSGWVEDPEYVASPPGEGGADRTADQPWGEWIKRYGLGEPLLTVPVRDQTASLYRQRHTGRTWYAITGIGGTFGPIGDNFGYAGTCFQDQCVFCGSLPPVAVAADAVTGGGQRLSVHTAAGAYLVVAP